MAKGVYRRGNSWLVRIRRGHHKIARTFDTYAEAQQFHERTIGQITGREYVDRTREQRTTLREILERYKTETSPTKKGHKKELSRLNAWIAEPWSGLPVISIDAHHVIDWKERKLTEGAAPSTVNNAINLLSAVFRQATQWKFRVVNPCVGVARVRQRPPRNIELPAAHDDERALLASCAEGPKWLLPMVRLAIATAMRAGELRRIERRHIHDTHIHLPETKNSEPRDVPLSPDAQTILRDIPTIWPGDEKWLFGDPDKPAADGGFPEDRVSRAFIRAVKRARKRHGLSRHVTFHDLRHVGATRLAPLHRDALELARTTGHKTIQMLARYYNPTPQERAAEIAEAAKRLATRKRSRAKAASTKKGAAPKSNI